MILVEPQCHKAEHSMVNALFINGLLKHSLGVNLIFFAEENHIELVSDNLHSKNQITFKSINIPKRGYSNERIVQLIGKPEPKNWPGYSTEMAPMPPMNRAMPEANQTNRPDNISKPNSASAHA